MTLFQWKQKLAPPRGSVSRSGVQDVDEAAVRELHGLLEAKLGTVDLVITNNRKRMVTAKRRGNRHELRVHHMFIDAPSATHAALAGLASGNTEDREVLQKFISDHRDAIDHTSNSTVRTRGAHHDLGDSLARALALLPTASAVEDIRITWGRYGRGRRSIRFGSYDFEARLIRIHPALDEAWVTQLFVDFVVYHELLHVVVPPVVDEEGRRDVHPPEFRELEVRFPDYDRAIAWQRDHLERLLSR